MESVEICCIYPKFAILGFPTNHRRESEKLKMLFGPVAAIDVQFAVDPSEYGEMEEGQEPLLPAANARSGSAGIQ
jgi:hypothetical protein